MKIKTTNKYTKNRSAAILCNDSKSSKETIMTIKQFLNNNKRYKYIVLESTATTLATSSDR